MGIQIEPPGPVDSIAPQVSKINTGSAAAPGAAGLIVAATPTVPGTYQVEIYFTLSGTVSASELDNIKLVVNGSTVSALTVAPAVSAGGTPIPFTFNIAWTAGSIALEAVAAATAGSVYAATMIVTQVG